MRLHDGRYLCRQCGSELEIPLRATEPLATIHAASGKPNMRVITCAGLEIHRCEIVAISAPILSERS
jgi:hypothetical protein